MLADGLKLLSGMLMNVFTPAKRKPFSHLDSVANCVIIMKKPFDQDNGV